MHRAEPDGGTLTITTANVAAGGEQAPRGAEVMPGDYVMIAVGDTGTGMTEGISQQVFEPFFTTKEWGSDTSGLGLSTCYGVVAQQGGHIRVHSEPGKGSTFRIYLPRQPLAVDGMERADTPLRRPRESLTVLVVDDEPGVRRLASRILRTRGYAVLEAASGAEALVVARAWHGRDPSARDRRRDAGDERMGAGQAAAGRPAGPRDALHVWLQRERHR